MIKSSKGALLSALGLSLLLLLTSCGNESGPNRSRGRFSGAPSPRLTRPQVSPRTSTKTGSNTTTKRSGAPNVYDIMKNNRDPRANVNRLRNFQSPPRQGNMAPRGPLPYRLQNSASPNE